MSEHPATISVSPKVELLVLTLLGWMHTVEVMIALESDAGRTGAVRVLTEFYNSIGRTLPTELKFEEKPCG